MGRSALIVTADDFGMSVEVNEAVEEAHRRGILTCASFVVTGAAAEDAARRARRMPNLGVGLHLALLAAPPASEPAGIRALMDREARGLGFAPVRTGIALSVSRSVQAQMRAETRAQLELFRKSGLALDHVDGHWHFHQHPQIVRTIVTLAPEYGIRAVRVPYEPPLPSWRAAGRRGLGRRMAMAGAHRLLAASMRRQFAGAGIRVNDWFFGMYDGGAIDRDYLLRLACAPLPGTTEIGLHPARRRWDGPHAPPAHWRAEDEFAALVDPEVIEACRGFDGGLIRFADLLREKRDLAA